MSVTLRARHAPARVVRRPSVRRVAKANERLLVGTLSVAVALLLWEGFGRGWWADLLGSNALRVKPIMLPTPTAIGAAAWRSFVTVGDIWPHLGLSGLEFLLAFIVAAGFAIPVGLVSGRFRDLSSAVSPLLNVLNATPQVALVPLFVLWFGTGLLARVLVIVLLMIVPLLLASFAAARTVDARLSRLAHSFGASELQFFRTIVLPASMPLLLTGVRLAVGRGMIGIVIGEIYGDPVGLGVMINQAGQTFQTTQMFVGVLTLVIAGLLLSEGVRWLERRVGAWRV